MKKSTVKVTKSTPPAKAASAKKAPAKAAVKKPVAVIKAKRPLAPAPAKKTAAKAPTAKAAPAKGSSAVTVITAQIDVGFGNTLFIRGEGAGLSWEKGVPLTPVGSDQWSITLPANAKSLIYKFLLNDDTWSTGEDYVSAAGKTAVHTPAF